ncbi:putative holin-like toxin [Peribacillus sp. NPDC096540]
MGVYEAIQIMLNFGALIVAILAFQKNK